MTTIRRICGNIEIDVNDSNETKECLIHGCGPKSMIHSLQYIAYTLRTGFQGLTPHESYDQYDVNCSSERAPFS